MITITDEQKKVIENPNKFVVVNAGPGTGKTTTAIQRIIYLANKGEKVIYFCYERGAVKHCYERLKEEFRSRNIKVTLHSSVEKDKRKISLLKVYTTTIDSFVGKLTPPGLFVENDYDKQMRNFLRELRENSQFSKETECLLQEFHFIIDEAQNIDDIRFQVIRFFEDHVKSVFIFGDPRQRLKEQAGGEFEKIWVKGEKYIKLFLSETFRFQSKNLLGFVNYISSTRPETHIELKNSRGFHTYDKVLIIEIKRQIKSILDVLDPILKEYENKGKDIMLISVALHSHSTTSKYANEVHNQLIRKYPKVKMTTIDSAKGLEADVVIVLGLEIMDILHIPRDIIFCKIFTAISRAREKLFLAIRVSEKGEKSRKYENKLYLTENGIPEEALNYIEPYNRNSNILEKIKKKVCHDQKQPSDIPKILSITKVLDELGNSAEEIFRDHIQKFIKCESIHEDFKLSNNPFESNNMMFIGKLYGSILGQLVTEKILQTFTDFTDAIIPDSYIEGRGRFFPADFSLENSRWVYNPHLKESMYLIEEIKHLGKIMKKHFHELTLKDFHEIFEVTEHLDSETGARDFVRKTKDFESQEKQVLKELRKFSIKIKELMKQEEKITAEENVRTFLHREIAITGRADISSEASIIEIKFCNYDLLRYKIQTLFYMWRENKRRGFLINIKNGKVAEMKIENKDQELLENLFGQLVDKLLFIRSRVPNDGTTSGGIA